MEGPENDQRSEQEVANETGQDASADPNVENAPGAIGDQVMDLLQDVEAQFDRLKSVQDTHADRRGSVRVPVKLRVGFATYGELRESLMTNLSRGGLFVSRSSSFGWIINMK